MRRTISTVFIATVFLVTGMLGCTTTKGYEGSAEAGTAKVLAHGVEFHTVNGKSVSMHSSALEVLPGKNTIELTLNRSNFNTDTVTPPMHVLEFTAVANTTYAVTTKRGHGSVCAYVLNPESGDPDFSKSAGCLQRR